jgi:hypothetical protein
MSGGNVCNSCFRRSAESLAILSSVIMILAGCEVPKAPTPLPLSSGTQITDQLNCDPFVAQASVDAQPTTSAGALTIQAFDCRQTPNVVDVHVVIQKTASSNVEERRFGGGHIVLTVNAYGADLWNQQFRPWYGEGGYSDDIIKNNGSADNGLYNVNSYSNVDAEGGPFGGEYKNDFPDAMAKLNQGALEVAETLGTFKLYPPVSRGVTKPVQATTTSDVIGCIIAVKTPSGAYYTSRTDNTGHAKVSLARTAADLNRLASGDVAVYVISDGTEILIGKIFLTDDDIAFAKRAVLPGNDAQGSPTTLPTGQQLPPSP